MSFYGQESLYGEFRTNSFQEIFPDYETFKAQYDASPFAGYTLEGVQKKNVSDENIELLFYSLYARYGNEHIAASDENRTKWRLFSIIAEYGPTWQSRLEFQRKVQNMTLAQLQVSNITINNIALHDQTDPSTSTTDELTFISEQNVQKTKRSEIDALNLRNEILRVDVTEQFLEKFKPLFCKFVGRRRVLLYENELEDSENG